MAEVLFSPQLAEEVRGKVVVMTGGAQGIGAATVSLLFNLGAHVFFGDWDESRGRELVETLQDARTDVKGSIRFTKLDVRDYSAQLQLFDDAYQKYGRVDVAISCAAVTEPNGWFGPEHLDLETVKVEPEPIYNTININLTSVVSFCRIALAYMKKDKTTDPSKAPQAPFSKSIVLVSSIAGLLESPGLFAYGSAKHGVVGLMRSLRQWAPAKYGVRVNTICPWATDTQLMDQVRAKWVEEGLPINTTEKVGKLIVQCACDKDLNGRAVLVGGGRGFDMEEGLDRTLPQWMGAELYKDFHRGQEAIGLGDDWSSKE
ncbi:hypothetical protein B0T11DRAFT_315576 [Plectosphaerella cucumerina]|uniref:Uncharacterized protein n=1 Tax=Plectosphaerella cucumerina TaxID=40658 RepID=A0A8K0THZ5_9PEZI|nr:hypothetical protein B0T11DRAFT_315576 [Plectosphaerella cucumerina]